jgi:hypothetical protein
MTSEKLTMDDGLMMRTLADSPGGLELHIGVSRKQQQQPKASGFSSLQLCKGGAGQVDYVGNAGGHSTCMPMWGFSWAVGAG